MRTINLDVDGLLYPSLELWEYSKIGVFEKYMPLKRDATVAFVGKVRELVNRKGWELKFLTKTCSISQELHEEHKAEKTRWLKRHLSATDEEIMVIRSSDNKSDCSKGILVDDYGQNCMNWEDGNVGNIAIQYNEIKAKSWLTAESYDYVLELIEKIMDIQTRVQGEDE